MTPPTMTPCDTAAVDPNPDAGPVVVVRGLVKRFATMDTTITAADGIDLDIDPGTVTALTGASGSGKSTLLHLIGALDSPDEGTITVRGTQVTTLRGNHAATYRASVGFVFQRFNLLPTLTVIDNVLVPAIPQRRDRAATRERAAQLLESVGLGGREHTLATRMSGGQQQRVAIARALMNAPDLILADEPTGNLDSATGNGIIDLLLGLREQHGTTILLATHDPDLAHRCDHTIHLHDGKIAD